MDRRPRCRDEAVAVSGPKSWHLDYVPDAATKRVTIVGSDGRRWEGNSQYDPCDLGIHLCGQTDDGEQPTTVANYPMASEDEARQLWELARGVAEVTDRDEEDFIVDLNLRDGCVDDFSSNRQLWPRAIEAWNAILKATGAA